MDFLGTIAATLALWVLGSLVVAYILDYAKGWAKAAPSWVWRIAVVLVSFGVGFALTAQGSVPIMKGLWWNFLGILAFSQGAYKVLVSKFNLPAPNAPVGTAIGFDPPKEG